MKLLDYVLPKRIMRGPTDQKLANEIKEALSIPVKTNVKAAPQPTAPEAVLVKAAVPIEAGELFEEEKRLAQEADNLLGYSAYRNHLSAKSGAVLGKVLNELGIQPFTIKSVHNYKLTITQKLIREHRSSMYHVDVDWKRYPLSRYTGKVEPFILSMAIEVKKCLPAADFIVEEVRVERTPYDPFLIVELGVESYYIGVWDEPNFERTLF